MPILSKVLGLDVFYSLPSLVAQGNLANRTVGFANPLHGVLINAGGVRI